MYTRYNRTVENDNNVLMKFIDSDDGEEESSVDTECSNDYKNVRILVRQGALETEEVSLQSVGGLPVLDMLLLNVD